MNAPGSWSEFLSNFFRTLPRLRGPLVVVGLAVVAVTLAMGFGADVLTKVLAAGVLVTIVALVLRHDNRRKRR